MVEITNIISAFSADQVVKLTGLTIRQLAYWDDLEFFKPQYAADDRHSPHSRIYSFKDVVGLRTLSILKKRYKCTLPHLREVAKKRETEQMNRSSAWFDKHYAGMQVKRVIIHPAGKIESATAFTHDVEGMRESDLKRFVKTCRDFFNSFESQDFQDISGSHVQKMINVHQLGTNDLLARYTRKLKDLK